MTTKRGEKTGETDATTRDTAIRSRWDRRTVLRASGVAIVGAVAGCLGRGGNDGGADSVEQWLSDTDNYDTTADMTHKQSVTVEVGAKGNDGTNAFAPAAIEITPGTTVTWQWVEGIHNVVATNEAFDSGEPEQDATFEHTFETTGTFQYYCGPHRSMGMKGAVIVGDDATTDNESVTQ